MSACGTCGRAVEGVGETSACDMGWTKWVVEGIVFCCSAITGSLRDYRTDEFVATTWEGIVGGSMRVGAGCIPWAINMVRGTLH